MILDPGFFVSADTAAEPVRAVLGGSCICYAKGNPARLSLQDLIDSLVPAIMAARNQCPVWLYFQAHEAAMMADFLHYDRTLADHTTMRSWLEDGVLIALSRLGLEAPPIHWIDSASAEFLPLVDRLSALVGKTLPYDRLWGLYARKEGATYPRETPEEALMLSVYYRNIALYTPDFLREGLQLDPHSAVFVENSTQRNAIDIYHRATGQAARVMLYPPAPNAHGKEMCLGNSNHSIELRHTSDQIQHRAGRIGHMAYYKQIFADVGIADFMRCWQREVGLT
jgi:hypothetical protein